MPLWSNQIASVLVKVQVKASPPSSLLKQCFVALSFFYKYMSIFLVVLHFNLIRWVLLTMHEIRVLKMDTENVVRGLYNDK